MSKVKWRLRRSPDTPELELRASIVLPNGDILVLKMYVPEPASLNKFMDQSRIARKSMKKLLLQRYEERKGLK